ncbi:TrkH family potassium uptake protein [bacterium]|nr:TrkH family potassium uptake protein [bacterium]
MRLLSIFKPLAFILLFIAFFMMIPCIMALKMGEHAVFQSFLIVACVTIAISLAFIYAVRNLRIHRLATRESFILVSLCWLSISLVSAIPPYLSGAIPNFASAFFEMTSGFSTTGATILTSIETMPKSIIFWRCFAHWIGGMGIIVLAVAIMPILGIGGMQLIKAEAPGPTVDKLSPRISETAKYLWGIYVGLTAIEIMLLRLGGMDYFDAIVHSFSTIATGGFSSKDASIAAYNSPFIEWIIIIFMFISGINFTVHYRIVIGKTVNIFKNSELLAYFAIAITATLLITLNLSVEASQPISLSIREAAFHATSILTTTGFSTTNHNNWPFFSRFVIFLLMCTGACSGSTSGGVKIIRIVLLFKLAVNELKYLVHPKAVLPIFLDGKNLKKDMIYPISAFVFLYAALVLATGALCAIGGINPETAIPVALSMVGNIGLGPFENYAFTPDWLKWILSFAMIIGRLEVFTVMVIFTRAFWKD